MLTHNSSTRFPTSIGHLYLQNRLIFLSAYVRTGTSCLFVHAAVVFNPCIRVSRKPYFVSALFKRLWKHQTGSGAQGLVGVGVMMATVKPQVRRITHVVFDMDGLLLDTETFYTVVQKKILAEYGKEFTWSLKAKMMGKKALEAGTILVQETNLEGTLTAEEFIKRRESMLQGMFPGSELMPGAERLIRHLHSHRVPIAVATSSHRRHFELKTTQHGPLFALFHHIVTGDDPAVAQGKPSPDIFLVASDRFEDPDLKVANVLVFEDAPTGVAAAHAAGMPVVMVPDPNLDASLCQEADQVLTSLLEFDPTHWGLPQFSSCSSSKTNHLTVQGVQA